MELLGVTASVVGIIGFTVKGLVIINDLREFSKGFSEEGTKDFLHNLDVSARILVDVKVLCEKIDHLFPNRSSDFRIASLQVQVEDCTRDLQHLLDVSQQRGKFKKKIRAFKDFLDIVSKSSRTGHYERFRMHQENMKTALAMTGRYLDAENSANLHLVRDGVQQLANRFSNDIKERNKTLESLSSSGSAVLALSRSTNDRLQDVQCITNDISTELEDMKRLLLEIHSNSSSAQSSCCENYHSGKLNQLPGQVRGQDENKKQGKSDKLSRKPISRSRSTPVDSECEEVELEDGLSDEENDQQRARGKHEAEFSIVVRASKDLAKTVYRMYHPFLADYACTLYAWHTNEIRARFMELDLPTGSWAENFDELATSRKVQHVKRKVQIQILTLRKLCLAEGLNRDLDAIDAEMGITETIVEAWEEEESNRQRSSQRLLLTDLDSLADQKKDRLTRINEWLLQVRESYQYLTQLHRNFLYSLMKVRGNSTYAPFPVDWDRLTLKYWFLDTAGSMTEEYPTSSLGSGESDATFMPLEEGTGICGEAHQELDEPLGFTQFFLRQPEYPSVVTGRKDAHPEALQSFIETTAGDLEPDVLAAAQRALANYGKEPAATVPTGGGDLHRTTCILTTEYDFL